MSVVDGSCRPPLAHVYGRSRACEERAEDLAQPRPELGHATNAITIVGRREWSRGLFLDRRAFLTSYDPTEDDVDCTILTRILQAVFPVCGGINLEYYFSHVDNNGYGAPGSKLPHNLAALLGVMDGGGERPADRLALADGRNPVSRSARCSSSRPGRSRCSGSSSGTRRIGKLCRNGWIQLAVLDPESRRIHRLRGGVSSIPTNPSRRPCPRLPPRSTGIAAGATISSSPSSSPRPEA